MVEEKKKNYPQNEEIFHPAKNRTVTRKKLSRITFDHISKLGEEFLGQLFCPLNENEADLAKITSRH